MVVLRSPTSSCSPPHSSRAMMFLNVSFIIHSFSSALSSYIFVSPLDFRTRNWNSLSQRSGPAERKPQAGLREPGAAFPAGANQQRAAQTQGARQQRANEQKVSELIVAFEWDILGCLTSSGPLVCFLWYWILLHT